MIRSSAGASQAAAAATLSFALFLAPWVIPFLGVMLSLWCPVPLLWLYRNKGLRIGRLGLILATGGVLIAFQFMDLAWAGSYFFFYAAVVAVLGEAPRFGISEDWAIGAASLAGMLMAFLVFFGIGLVSGHGMSELLRAHWQRELDMVVGMYGQMGLDAAAMQELRQTLAGIGKLFFRLSPGLLIIGSLLVAWANLLLVQALRRRKAPETEAGRYTLLTWKVPERLVWLLIASGALMVLADGLWFWVGANLVAVLGLLYFFQGLAVLSFWLRKKNVPVFLRAGIYVFLALEFFLVVIVAAAGLFDLWFNLRRLKPQKSA